MSSVNPVFLLPGALQDDAESIAKGFVASLTLGAGQFCTNPGLVFAARSAGLDRFIARRPPALSGCDAQTMLTPGDPPRVRGRASRGSRSARAWRRAREATRQPDPTRRAARCSSPTATRSCGIRGSRRKCSARRQFSCASTTRSLCSRSIDALEGQLSATIHLRETDFALASRLLPALERKAGRIIANGWPTGVEVAHAMVHGGPFPATSDSRTTSVGSLAIERFLRPVCYQDLPAALLPDALRDGDGRFERLVDGIRVGPRRRTLGS